jgi:predicted dehydrogenase
VSSGELSSGPKGTAGPLRVAVVGAGAFGRNHVRVYAELHRAGAGVELCAVVDRDPAVLAAVRAQYGVAGYTTVEELLAACAGNGTRLDAASVCVPTVHHADVADRLLPAGIDLLIEKPLAATLEEADRIVALAATHGRVVQAGHLERFNPAVIAARRFLNRPMFFEAHRLSVFTPRSLDVDVVLDLMIHDLDIVLSLVDSPVREVRAVGLPVLSGKVDIANVRVEFEDGCVANFTASRVSTERVRKLRFFQPRQYLSLDFARQDLLVIDAPDMGALVGMDAAQLAAMVAAAQAGSGNSGQEHPSAGLSLRKAEVEAGEPLRLEISSFLDAVRMRAVPVVSAADGRRALGLALEINAAIAEHARRAGLTLLR